MLRFVLSFILVIVFFLVGWMLEGGNPLKLLGPSSFIITFFVPFFAVISTWSFKDWRKAFSIAFTATANPEEVRMGVALWLLWERLSFIGGVLGFIGAMILILGGLPTPDNALDLNLLGRQIGVALIAPLYGIFFAIFGRIMKTRIEENVA